MQRFTTKLLAAMLPIVLPIVPAVIAGCGQDNPGTSVKVALVYNDALGMDTAEVTLTNRTESAPIAHELLLLVPDELAGATMPIEVWGRKAGKRAAYGVGTAIPTLGKTVETELTLTTCTPACQGDLLMTCTGPMVTCALGCTEAGDAHCIGPRPSNGVDPTAADLLNGTAVISGDTTFDTDNGAISGGLNRAAGTGNGGGIGYVQAPAFSTGGAPLGIFVFHNLTVEAAATVRFTGTRAAVLLVGDAAQIAGVIDVAAGRGPRSTPGPGGGGGGSEIRPALGCGAGGPGTKSPVENDSGGGGAGGGTDGGPGGDVGATPGGAGGQTCLPALLEPLQGGSGGGRGSRGGAATAASGGGGGGALQITALGSLAITGTINAGGAGGDGGPTGVDASLDGGSGGGGGAGGGILLEAPLVIVGTGATLAANGGGGGGGGGSGSAAGGAGDNASASLIFAQGGFGAESTNSGATGGAGGPIPSPPDAGGTGTTNGGGGGGAVGAIAIRGRTRMITGRISPAAVQGDVQASP
jgi:hypothetical protein